MLVDFRRRPFRRPSSAIAPRRPLNPHLRRCVRRSGTSSVRLATVAGFSHKQALYFVLREERISATPLTVARLERIADAVGFPRDEIFLDEAAR